MKNEKFKNFFYPIALKVHNIRTSFSSHPLWESATPFFVVCCLEHRKNLLVYTVWIRKFDLETKKETLNEFMKDVISNTSDLEILLKVNLYIISESYGAYLFSTIKVGDFKRVMTSKLVEVGYLSSMSVRWT